MARILLARRLGIWGLSITTITTEIEQLLLIDSIIEVIVVNDL